MSPPQTQISKLWCNCNGSFSSPNVKLVLFPFPQLMQNLCYFCFYLLSKHEAYFIFLSSINVKFVLFSSFFQECLCYSFSHFPMMVHHLNRYKERHILLGGMHMSKLSQELTQTTLEESQQHPLHMREIFAQQIFMHHKTEAYTNHLEREPTHPLHTREIFAQQIFMHHKTEDTNFIFEFRRKIGCHSSYVIFHFSQSSCSDFSFTLSVSPKPTWFSSCVLPTLLYFTDKFIESVEVHPQKKVSNNGQQVDWGTGGCCCCSNVAPQDLTIAR